jgi:hypothetical protein
MAISPVFAAHGTVTGTYAARLPWIAGHVHARPGEPAPAVEQAAAPLWRPLTGRFADRVRTSRGTGRGKRLAAAGYSA